MPYVAKTAEKIYVNFPTYQNRIYNFTIVGNFIFNTLEKEHRLTLLRPTRVQSRAVQSLFTRPMRSFTLIDQIQLG